MKKSNLIISTSTSLFNTSNSSEVFYHHIHIISIHKFQESDYFTATIAQAIKEVIKIFTFDNQHFFIVPFP